MEGFNSYLEEDANLYNKRKWWLDLTIGDLLDRTADIYPEKEALVDETKRYTYGELKKNAELMAYQMLRLGLRPGDTVLLQLPNWAEFVISYYALQKAGLVMVLLTVNHTAKEISHLVKLTRPKAWIVPDRYRKTDYIPIIKRVQTESPGLEKVILVRSQNEHNYESFESLMKQKNKLEEIKSTLEISRPDPRSVCQILPSGGTTGLPKGAPRTHNDYVCNIEFTSKSWQMNPDDVCLVASTVGHNLALLIGITGPVFHGAKIIMLDSSYQEDFCRIIQDEKVTCMAVVPTLISRVINYEKIADYNLDSMKKIYVGAANSPPELVRLVESKFGKSVYINGFGMVEGPLCQSRVDDTIEIRSNTIGRRCCPYDQICTIDDEGTSTPSGVEGELVAKGPGIFTGYFANPEANKEAFTNDGFFRTGDLAVINKNGHIRITGRIKDVIIRGGENIAARDVEDIISSLPKVEYVAAVGMEDPDLGEAVCAFVKPVEGENLCDTDILAQLTQLETPKRFIPARIEVVENIPLTAAGKADKKVLKKQIRISTM